MRIAQIELHRDIAADFHCRSAEMFLKPNAKSGFLRDRQPRFPDFPTVISHHILVLRQIFFIPATHRVVIKVKHLRNLDTGLPVIQQQKRIRAARSAMILALTFYTAQKLAAVFAGKKFGTDHRPRKIYSRENLNKFFGSSMARIILE